LKCPNFVAYANKSSHGMNLPRLGTSKAVMAVFPLPPLQEQKEMVLNVNNLLSLCDNLESQVEKSLEQIKTLLFTILSKTG